MAGWVFVVRYCELKMLRSRSEASEEGIDSVTPVEDGVRKMPSTNVQPEKVELAPFARDL